MKDYGFKYIPQLTLDEIKALSTYKMNSDRFCSILAGGYEVEKSFADANHIGGVNPFFLDGYENPQGMIKTLCNLYSAIYKMSKQRAGNTEEKIVYRGTRKEEVEMLKNEGIVSKYLSTTDNRLTAVGRFALSWKSAKLQSPALMILRLSNDTPYIKYSSVVGLDTGNGNTITDLDEDEILVSPFCSINVDDGEYTRVGYGEYLTEYNASTSKAQLQEITADEELESIKYLTDHSQECTEAMKSILSDELVIEQYELGKKIFSLNTGISEMRQGLVDEQISAWIKEDFEKIKQCKQRIKELEETEKDKKDLVNEFKRRLRSVCMSRCKGIERAIDFDYEKQKDEFVRRKKEEELQRKTKEKEKIIENTDVLNEESKEQSSKLNMILRQKQYIKQISSNLDIPYFEYLKNAHELLASNQDVNTAVLTLDSSITGFKKQNIDDIGEKALSEYAELMDGIRNNAPDYDRLCDEYTEKQNQAFLYAIHQKILWHKSIMHYNSLSIELQQIQSRSTLDKVKDFFKGQSRYKRETAAQIQKALELINQKKMEYAKIPLYTKKVDAQTVYEELEQMKDLLSEGITDRFGQMRDFIVQNFHVDTSAHEKQDVSQSNENLLPAVQSDNKKISAEQRMNIFLERNGYTQKQGQEQYPEENKFQSIQINGVDEISLRCVQRNGKCVSLIAKLMDCLGEGEDKQEPIIRGLGDGFHIVR